MDSARTQSPANLDIDRAGHQTPQDQPQDKISAYYSLVFPHFTFYIQTLSITIGRRCTPNPNLPTSSTAEQPTVDVDLGALKSVSRLHAKIEYDQDEDRFVLVVIGRNGAWVDGVWSGAGTRAPLCERSQIQIASRTFHFVLPPPPAPEDTPSPSSQSSVHRERSPSVDITSISPPSSQPSHSPVIDVKPLPESSPPPSPPRLPPMPVARTIIKAEPPPELPNSNSIGKNNKSNAKKRKKGDVEPPPPIIRPKPEDMPPKPPFTYAQLIYRAIKDIGGKATLQEICHWIMNTHEYYRYADGAWMSSVRHNLSSGRAFLKMERCGGDRGKGFFWSVDEKYAQVLEEQESKAAAAAQAAASGLPKDMNAPMKQGRKKDKAALEPPLKRSIKGDVKGTPLPPPLTSTPLSFKTGSTSTSNLATVTSSSYPTIAPVITPTTQHHGPNPSMHNTAATGIFPYPTTQQTDSKSAQTQYATSSSVGSVNPYASLTHWSVHTANGSSTSGSGVTMTAPAAQTLQQALSQAAQAHAHSSAPPTTATPMGSNPATGVTPYSSTHATQPYSRAHSHSATPAPVQQQSYQAHHQSQQPKPQPPQQPPPQSQSAPPAPTSTPASQVTSGVPDVVIPIVLGAIPPTHPDYTPNHPNNSAKEGYMVLHERTLILDPNVFGGLTGERLKEIERMGARAALAVLTQHMVKALKERRKANRVGKKAKKGLTSGGAGAGTTAQGEANGSGTAAAGQAQPQAQSQLPAPEVAVNPSASTGSATTPIPPSGSATPGQAEAAEADPGSPLIVVDDSGDEGPAAKRRKLDDSAFGTMGSGMVIST